MGGTALNGLDVGTLNICGELLPAEKPRDISIHDEPGEHQKHEAPHQKSESEFPIMKKA
jgi:hypothetical protein